MSCVTGTVRCTHRQSSTAFLDAPAWLLEEKNHTRVTWIRNLAFSCILMAGECTSLQYTRGDDV